MIRHHKLRIRQSTLETARCLFRYNGHHNLGIPDPESEFADRGTAFHEMARQYVNYLVQSRQETDWSYAETLTGKATNMEAAALFSNWYKDRSFDPGRIFASEYAVRLDWDLRPCPSNEAAFAGDMDLVEIEGTEAEITDFKTHFGSFEPTTTQSIFYPWLLWKLVPHLTIIRFTLEFVRWNIRRTREFQRDQLERMDRFVENQVARLVEAYETDEWPASVNSKCSYCRLECPLVAQGLTRQAVGQIQNHAQAESMAQQLFALQRAARQIQASLRGYAIHSGDITAGNDLVLGFDKQEQFEYDTAQVSKLNEQHGFNRLRGMRVDGREIKKIGKQYPEFAAEARRKARDRGKTVFKFRSLSGDPLEDQEDDIVD